MSTFARASYVPFFDRLCEQDPSRLQAGGALRESLRRDLQRLLNTRNGQTLPQFLAGEGTVLQYGLPDVMGLCAGSETDLQVLAQVVAHGISLYEPRLSGVRVTARPDLQQPGRAWLAISGEVLTDRILQRVDFEIGLDDPAPQTLA